MIITAIMLVIIMEDLRRRLGGEGRDQVRQLLEVLRKFFCILCSLSCFQHHLCVYLDVLGASDTYSVVHYVFFWFLIVCSFLGGPRGVRTNIHIFLFAFFCFFCLFIHSCFVYSFCLVILIILFRGVRNITQG